MGEPCLRTAAALMSCVGVWWVLAGEPSSAQAQPADRPALPSGAWFVELGRFYESLDASAFAQALADGRVSAGDCVSSPQGLRCASVVWNLDVAHVRANVWASTKGAVSLSGARVVLPSGMTLKAKRAEWNASGFEFTGARIRFESGVELGAKHIYARLRPVSEEVIRLENMTWVGESKIGSAERAIWRAGLSEMPTRAGGWQLEWLALGPRERLFLIPKTDGVEPVAGFLPPSLIYTDEGAEFEVMMLGATGGRHGLGAFLRGWPGDWYGFGLSLVSRSRPSARGLRLSSPGDLALAGVAWRPGARPGFLAEGRAALGTPARHVALDLERPGLPSAWATQRVRRADFFDAWSRSALGGVLNGDGFGLRVAGVETRRARGFGDGQVSGIHSGFGVAYRFSETTAWEMEATHESRDLGEAPAHRTDLRAKIAVDVGRVDRVFARLEAIGRMKAGLAQTETGLDAGTGSDLFVASRAGLSLTRRGQRTMHRVRPTVFAVAEVAGFDHPVLASASASDAGSRSAVAGVGVDQTWTQGGWQWSLPAEVSLIGGLDRGQRPTLLAAGTADVSYVGGMGSFEAWAHLACEADCSDRSWDVGAALRFDDFRVDSHLSRAGGPAERLGTAHLTGDLWDRVPTLERGRFEAGLAQRASLSWESTMVEVGATGVTDSKGWGVVLRGALRAPGGGWGVHATTFVDGFDEHWGWSVGLDTGRRSEASRRPTATEPK